MTAFDWVALAVVSLSFVVGLFRGFVREVLSLAGWIAAGLIAATYAEQLARVIPAASLDPLVRWGLAFILIVVAVLIGTGMISFVVRRLLRAVGLGGADRLFGALFGAARGVAVLVVFVFLGGLTPLREQAFWKDSQVIPLLETVAASVQPLLPDAVRARLGRA